MLLKQVLFDIRQITQDIFLTEPGTELFLRELEAAGVTWQLLSSARSFPFSLSDSSVLITDTPASLLSSPDPPQSVPQEEICCLGLLHDADASLSDFPGVQAILLSLSEISAGYLEMTLCHFLNEPFTVAVTDRLVIRESKPEDFDALYELMGELPDPPFPCDGTVGEVRCRFLSYLDHAYRFFGYGIWTVSLRETGRIAGWCGLYNDPELHLGYVIHPQYRRQGLALEAGRAILDYAENELGIDHVYAKIRSENRASLALAADLGLYVRMLP